MTAAHVTKSIAHHAQRAVFLAILLCLAVVLATPVQAAGDDDGWSGTRKDNDVAAAEKKIAAEDFAGASPLLEKATRTNPRMPSISWPSPSATSTTMRAQPGTIRRRSPSTRTTRAL